MDGIVPYLSSVNAKVLQLSKFFPSDRPRAVMRPSYYAKVVVTMILSPIFPFQIDVRCQVQTLKMVLLSVSGRSS